MLITGSSCSSQCVAHTVQILSLLRAGSFEIKFSPENLTFAYEVSVRIVQDAFIMVEML